MAGVTAFRKLDIAHLIDGGGLAANAIVTARETFLVSSALLLRRLPTYCWAVGLPQ